MILFDVNSAVRAIIRCYAKGDMETIQETIDYINNDPKIAGSASDFHNAGAELARIGAYSVALSILEVGHKRYDRDIDLVADILAYGIKCRKIEDLFPYYEEMCNVRKRNWTWRGFVFGIDYLMQYIQYVEDDNEEDRVKKSIEIMISDYKMKFPKDERAYVAESELYEYLGDTERRITALKNGIENAMPFCQCALGYADYLFEIGSYEKVIPVVEKAVNIREDQPSVSIGYLYYILAMSKEVCMRKTNEQLTESLVRPVYNAYHIAHIRLEKEGGRERLIEQIENYVEALEIESGIKSNINIEHSSIDVSDLIDRLQMKADRSL